MNDKMTTPWRESTLVLVVSIIVDLAVGLVGGTVGWLSYGFAGEVLHNLSRPTPNICFDGDGPLGYLDYLISATLLARLVRILRGGVGRATAVGFTLLAAITVDMGIVLITDARDWSGQVLLVPGAIGGTVCGSILAIYYLFLVGVVLCGDPRRATPGRPWLRTFVLCAVLVIWFVVRAFVYQHDREELRRELRGLMRPATVDAPVLLAASVFPTGPCGFGFHQDG